MAALWQPLGPAVSWSQGAQHLNCFLPCGPLAAASGGDSYVLAQDPRASWGFRAAPSRTPREAGELGTNGALISSVVLQLERRVILCVSEPRGNNPLQAARPVWGHITGAAWEPRPVLGVPYSVLERGGGAAS